MKNVITLNVSGSALDGRGRDWKVTLTRHDLENALAELNKPDSTRPFLPGEKVRHQQLFAAILLVLGGRSLVASQDYVWVANVESGYTFKAEKTLLTHLEEAK